MGSTFPDTRLFEIKGTNDQKPAALALLLDALTRIDQYRRTTPLSAPYPYAGPGSRSSVAPPSPPSATSSTSSAPLPSSSIPSGGSDVAGGAEMGATSASMMMNGDQIQQSNLSPKEKDEHTEPGEHDHEMMNGRGDELGNRSPTTSFS